MSASAYEPKSDFDTMVFDVYRIREGTDDTDYERWLTDIDVPVFRDRDMVAGYYCCKVIQSHGRLAPYSHNSDLPFTHFGQIGLTDDAAYVRMMDDPIVQAHVPAWVNGWSVDPAADDLADNFSFNMAKRRYSTGGNRKKFLVMVPFARADLQNGQPAVSLWAGAGATDIMRAADGVRYESWEITENLLGTYGPNGVDIFYVDDPGLYDLIIKHADAAVFGTVIAGP